jgi:hypothetical protein
VIWYPWPKNAAGPLVTASRYGLWIKVDIGPLVVNRDRRRVGGLPVNGLADILQTQDIERFWSFADHLLS